MIEFSFFPTDTVVPVESPVLFTIYSPQHVTSLLTVTSWFKKLWGL